MATTSYSRRDQRGAWEEKSSLTWPKPPSLAEGAALSPLQNSSPTSTVTEQCEGSGHCPPRAGGTRAMLQIQRGRPGVGWAWQAEPKNVNIVLNAVWLLLEPLDVRSRGNHESGLSQGADLGIALQRWAGLERCWPGAGPSPSLLLAPSGEESGRAGPSRLPICTPCPASTCVGETRPPLLGPCDRGIPGTALLASIFGGGRREKFLALASRIISHFPFPLCLIELEFLHR